MLWTIVKKELTRVFTDKRLIFTSFILPGLSIFIMYSIMGLMIDKKTDSIETSTKHVAVYNAPDAFVDFYQTLESTGFELEFKEGADNMTDQDLIKSGDLELMLVFDDKFMEQVKDYDNQGVPPTIKAFYNSAEEYSQSAGYEFTNVVLAPFEQQILIDRFGNANAVKGFVLDQSNDLAEQKQITGKMLSTLLPMLLTIFLFAGAMGIGLDTIAGEKERGTMAAMLLAPIPRNTIAFGKVIGLAIVSVISACTSFAAIVASMPFAKSMFGGDDAIKVSSLSFSMVSIGELFVILILLVLIFVSVICAMSVRAKNIKEAGTMITPIYLIVMMASMSTMFMEGSDKISQFMIPIYGHVLALKAFFSYTLTFEQFGYVAVSSVVTIVVLLQLLSKSFDDEKVMFNA